VVVLLGNFNIHCSGTAEYFDLQAKYRLLDICQFLKSLSPEQMERDRDAIILNLLFYTTTNKKEMSDVLKGYLENLR